MNTQSNTMPGAFESPGSTARILDALRPFYWSIRRELWESRSIYVGPLVAAVLFLVGFVVNLSVLRRNLQGSWPLDPAPDVLATRYELAAALIMGTELIVGVFYTLDALYGERRDRSILFWKSLPVSDRTTVLSKFTIPIVILPLLSFAITIATQFVMLVMATVMLPGTGVNVAALWTHTSFLHVSLVIFYHFVTVHGLWYAPLYGWLLLVSAWAPRAPFIWAFLPPFVICGLEKVAFNTTYCLSMLVNRLGGPRSAMATQPHEHGDFMALLIPHHFFTEPGLWIGLAIAVIFVFASIRLRRYRGPI